MSDNKIELRSEKVRHIIGEIPSRIVRYGITIITIVMLGLLIGAYFIPYPETISAMTANIEFEGYDAETYGVANAVITATSHIPLQTEAGSVFTAQVRITDYKYNLVSGMTGTVSILESNESVLQRIVKRIKNII